MTELKDERIHIYAQTTRFNVTKSILTKHNSYFRAICDIHESSYSFADVSDKIEIDCPPEVFRKILDYFITNEVVYTESEYERLLGYVEHYCIEEMALYMKGMLNQYKDIPPQFMEMYKSEYDLRSNFDKYYKESDDILIDIYESDIIPPINLDLMSKHQTILKKGNIKESTPAYNTYEHFTRIFNNSTNGVFLTFSSDDFNNLFIAGGAVLQSLILDPRYTYNRLNDIDIFIYGLDEEAAEKKINLVVHKICSYFDKTMLQPYEIRNRVIYRSPDSITINIAPTYKCAKFQIIYSRLYKTKSEILLGFDIDCCCCGYDLDKIYVLPKTLFSLIHRINIVGIDKSRFSKSYENRLLKYSYRGFGVYVPGLNFDKLKYTDHIPFKDKHGLCKLLHLNRGQSTYLKPDTSTTEPNSQNNYDYIKIPDNVDPTVYWNNIVVFNVDETRKEKLNEGLPLILIRLGEHNSTDYKHIIDYTKINNEYRGIANKPLHTEIDQLRRDYYVSNDYNILRRIIICELKLKFINDETYKNLEPITPDQKIFDFVYPYRLAYSNRYDKTVFVKTTVPPYINFKTINPGEQIKGTYQEDISFYSQAYGVDDKHFLFDFNQLDNYQIDSDHDDHPMDSDHDDDLPMNSTQIDYDQFELNKLD